MANKLMKKYLMSLGKYNVEPQRKYIHVSLGNYKLETR